MLETSKVGVLPMRIVNVRFYYPYDVSAAH